MHTFYVTLPMAMVQLIKVQSSVKISIQIFVLKIYINTWPSRPSFLRTFEHDMS